MFLNKYEKLLNVKDCFMEIESINFNENMILTGSFEIPEFGVYFGKLFYKKNEKCEILIYTDKNTFNLEEIKSREIFAILTNEKEKIYFVTLFDCRLYQSSFSSAVNTFVGYFDYGLFSKQRHFNSATDNLRNKANIYINTWAEFCFPQGFKNYAGFESKINEVKLKNEMKISFNQDIKGFFLTKNNIFNSLFVNQGLSKLEVKNIEKNLNTILIPYKERIKIKNSENHKWFIQVENIPKTLGIDITSYYLGTLIKCLTHNFGSEVEKIEILSRDKYPVIFDYLCYRKIINKNLKYNHRKDVFNVNTFSKTEWTIILNNLFTKSKTIEHFFNILVQNNYEQVVSEYHLERYIDCISAIAVNKNFSNESKYENVLKDFASDFSPEIKNKLLNIFRKSLKNIEIKSKKFKKRNWGRIGKQLSELRALTTHFNETCKDVYMARYLDIYFILELIIIDYIFELLEINKDKRFEYKLNYLKNFLQIY